jgi:hypothetical protein
MEAGVLESDMPWTLENLMRRYIASVPPGRQGTLIARTQFNREPGKSR